MMMSKDTASEGRTRLMKMLSVLDMIASLYFDLSLFRAGFVSGNGLISSHESASTLVSSKFPVML